MIIEGKRTFNLPEAKPVFAQWFVSLDISEWLGTETIQTVDWLAFREDTGADATSVILDTNKCTYSGAILKPFINQGGETGKTYLVEMRVTTNAGSKDVWRLRVDIEEALISKNLTVALDAIL